MLAMPHSSAFAAILYTARITGVADSDLTEALTEASLLVSLRDRPPPSLRGLTRRANEDVDRLQNVLRSRGFYAGGVAYRVENAADGTTLVTLAAAPGPAFHLDEYRIRVVGGVAPVRPISVTYDAIGLRPGQAGEAAKIEAAGPGVLAIFARNGHPLASIADRRIVVDHATKKITVDLDVNAGPAARFGAVRVTGGEGVAPAHVRRQILWREGELFDATLLEKTRARLRESGLFDVVDIVPASEVDAAGTLPVEIVLTERLQRSIGLGVSYATNEGALAKVFWERRNLFGQGERLQLRGEVGELRTGAFAGLRLPDILRRDQDLVFELHATEETPDGFRSTEFGATGRMERRFSEIYAGSVGLGFDQSHVVENGLARDFSLLSLPLSFKRDTADDIFDPGSGGRLSLTLTPHLGLPGTDIDFVVARLSDTLYLPLLPEKRLIAAGWARLGTIVGASTIALPANKRLYAGGSGSVRGYGPNKIGPLDAQNDPIGGTSSTEFGAELRWRVSESIGLTGFVEAGAVYDTAMPDWGQDLRWSVGIGARYYSAIGPLRLDLAVPLDRRAGVDDSFAILMSLGQAF
jgi:translocation and assembly module TamA